MIMRSGEAIIDKEEKETRPDGREVWVITTKMPLRSHDGEVISTFGISRDITERKKAEETLQRSEEQVRLLLNSTAEAIYSTDLEGNCTLCNPASLRLLGYDKTEDLLGKNMHSLIHHSFEDGTAYPIEDCKIYEALTGEKPRTVTKRSFGAPMAPISRSNTGPIPSAVKTKWWGA